MKTFLRWLLSAIFVVSVVAVMGAELVSTITEMPDEVTLTSGRILRNVQVVRWEKDRVVLKYSGGIDPIAFSLFKEPSPSDVAAIRAVARKVEKKVTAPTNRTVSGQVFVTTRGAGAYKFGGAQVLVFPLTALSAISASVESEVYTAKAKAGTMANFNSDRARYDAWIEATSNIQALASTSTDAEGMFRLNVSAKEPLFIFCATHRAVGMFGEYNVWAVPIEKADRIDLNGSNQF